MKLGRLRTADPVGFWMGGVEVLGRPRGYGAQVTGASVVLPQ